MNPLTLETERLLLRPWREGDLDALARLTSDPVAMRYFPALLSREESDAYGRAATEHFTEHGYGRWVVERKEEPGFIGFSGLKVVSWDAAFTPAIEIGYRFLAEFWGQGYATEASLAATRDGFERLGFDRIVGFTATTNRGSQRVLEKIGYTRVPENDFDHPLVPVGHELRRHLYYEARSPLESLGGD